MRKSQPKYADFVFMGRRSKQAIQTKTIDFKVKECYIDYAIQFNKLSVWEVFCQ